jgi:hypothetical protein
VPGNQQSIIFLSVQYAAHLIPFRFGPVQLVSQSFASIQGRVGKFFFDFGNIPYKPVKINGNHANGHKHLFYL